MGGYEGASDDLTVAHRNSSATHGSLVARSRLRRTLLCASAKSNSRRSWCPAPPEVRVRDIERSKKSPMSFARALSATATASCTPARFAAWPGKTQVFIFPDDHMRTRLTHALEVAQVATGIARPLGLNVALTEAIALGHDCGHGPGGHASEEALDPFVEGGFDHATWGADVSLVPLNLCAGRRWTAFAITRGRVPPR